MTARLLSLPNPAFRRAAVWVPDAISTMRRLTGLAVKLDGYFITGFTATAFEKAEIIVSSPCGNVLPKTAFMVLS